MEPSFVSIGVLQGTEISTYTAIVLNKEYPNVEFEVVDVGHQTYRIQARSKYNDVISPKTTREFRAEMFRISRIADVILSAR
jgi:hypothetical protein